MAAVDRPLRVAVVGSGPAAFYAAGHLLASEDPRAEVDLIERLPTPWGLVRLGVAPDHPNLKTVSRAFEKIALRPGFRFLGNVEVGRDVSHDELVALYDAVVYAVGSQTDRRLGILTLRDERGAPRGVPLWYGWDGRELEMFSGRGSRTLASLYAQAEGRDPSETVLVGFGG